MWRENELVLRLGKSVVREDDLRRATDLVGRGLQRDRLKAAARKAKTLPCLLANLRLLPPRQAQTLGDLLGEFKARLDPQPRRRELAQEFARWSCRFARQGLAVLGLKGLALMVLRPGYRRRWLSDLDLLFPDLEALLTGVRLLLEDGFEIPEGGEAPLLYDGGSGSVGARVAVYGPSAKFDLHGLSLIVEGGPWPALDLWARARQATLGGETVLVTSPEDTILVLVVHAVGHGYFTLKDTNDLHALLAGSGSDLDWDYLTLELTRLRLDRVFSFLLDFLAREYDLADPVPLSLRPRLRPAGSLGVWLRLGGWAMSGRPWPLRAVVDGLLLHEYAAQAAEGPPGWRHVAGRLRRWAEGRDGWLASLLTRWTDVPGAALRLGRPRRGEERFFDPGLHPYDPVYLTEISPGLQAAWLSVPAERTTDWKAVADMARSEGLELRGLPDTPFRVVRVGRHEVLISSMGLFIPTRDFCFTEEELAELESFGRKLVARLAAGSAPAVRGG